MAWLHITADSPEVLHALRRIERLLQQIHRDLVGVEEAVTDQSQEVQRMATEVSENTSATNSAIQLLGDLSAQIRAAANDPAAINALADQLDSNTNALAAAVVANTPASTEPPPPPDTPVETPPDGGEPTG